MQVEQRMEQFPRASVGLRVSIGWKLISKHGTYTARVAESGKISCDQVDTRGEQLLNRGGFYEKGLLFFLYSVTEVDLVAA